MSTLPFTPLLDPGKERYDNPSFMNTPQELHAAQAKATPQANPVIPQELSSIEDNLKAEGSGTSTLSLILAIAGAAKGDFRGLQSIEESKRRTALAKSMVPEINKVNTLTNSGKWEEASDYVNKLVSSYGTRAEYLVPYFTAMQAKISAKQEGWNNLVARVKMMESAGVNDPKNINYPAYKALSDAVKERTPASETNMLQFMTLYGAPETQIIDRRKYTTSRLSGETRTEQFSEPLKVSDFTNFAGNTVASKHGLNLKQMADLHNGLPVKADTGETITPDSKTAQTISTQYNALLPINARLEMAALAQIPPEVAVRLLQEQGLLKTAIRDFGQGNVVQNAYDMIRGEDTRKQIAVIKGTEAEKTISPNEGFVVHLDDTDPDTFFSIKTDPTTINDVTSSKGKLGIIPPNMMPIVQQNQSAIQGINTALDMMDKGVKLDTLGDRLAQGFLAQISKLPKIGFPITKEIETRQIVKTILNTAIEQIENTPVTAPNQIRGGDREEVKQLKRFASGDFRSEADVVSALQQARTRLVNSTKMLTGQSPPQTAPPQGAKRTKTPVEALAPAIPQRGRQVTHDPYGPGGIQIPPDIEEGMRKAVEEVNARTQGKRQATAGSTRIPSPQGQQPAPVAPSPPQQYNEDDEIARSSAQKRLQRGVR